MAQETYTIKKGDTLGRLASQFGVGIGDITGYRSGDPNKIYEGETIKIGKADAPQTYASEVKSQLGTPAPQTKTETDPYGIETLKTKATDYATKKDTAYNSLKDIETSTYNDEYAKRNLAEKKTRIGTIDSDIATARSERDNAIAKVRSNPGLSAAQMAGDVKKLADFQNSKINDLIAERNSIAGEYNTALGEIEKVVNSKKSDKEREYNYYAGLEKSAKDSISEYQKTLKETLAGTQKQSNFEKSLAQALEIAKMKAENTGSSTTYRLITDPVTGDPLYWIDPKTMQTFPASAEDKQSDAETPAPAETDTSAEQPGYLKNLWNALIGNK